MSEPKSIHLPSLRQGVCLDLDSLHPSDLKLEKLKKSLTEWHFHGHTTQSQLHERIAEAHVIITNKVEIDAAALAAAPDLKLICVAATGVNNIDLIACEEHGVTVVNCRNYGTASVVQHTFALMLSLANQLPANRELLSDRKWQKAPHFAMLNHPPMQLAGKYIGIVGYGALGKAVAHLAEALGMVVLVAERADAETIRPGRVAFKRVLKHADVVTLHCPLTAETRDLIDANALSLMKPDALLINTARGGIVNEHALLDALLSEKLGGAATDVLSKEPPVNSNPLLEVSLPNLIITPHLAWGSQQSRQLLVDQVEENILAAKNGTPIRVVSH
ncbi:D-2-hydroxyacid dehydrogenase [Corallincola platygyrae]|uniref:D-2-hydroxyacid dehydrogenase n=1 Tax=Corallincola platygyrae TaxID=1193278 RepID=A0ABW4XPM5_9GAMM